VQQQVPHTTTEADKKPARKKRRRGLELAGLAAGIVAGVSITLAWLVPARSHPTTPSTYPPALIPGATARAEPDAAALDAEWVAYSDHSTCADWAGGDGVSALRLNSDQLAWFFSDTTIGPAGPTIGLSHLSGFVHNSLVIQTAKATGSTFVTVTGGRACTAPGGPGDASPVVGPPPAVPGGPSDRYWDEDGLTTGKTIVKFYVHYRVGLQPYVPLGTVIATFPVSELSQEGQGSRYGATVRPRLITLPSYTPPGGGAPVVWGAALLQAGNTIYIYGTQSPNVHVSDARLYLARVPAAELTSFSEWQFYAGHGQWATGQQKARPVQPKGSTLAVSSGFSVVHAGDRYWLIQIGPALGTTDIDAYPARTPWGPFDVAKARLIYRDPAIGLDAAHEYRVMYEARAEPALSTPSTLVISYNVNSEAVTTGCVPMSAFTNTAIQPRFIAVPTAALGNDPPAKANTAQAQAVSSGPPGYPPIVQQNPSQWFDAWSYPGDCPPVPAVTSVQVRPGPGKVALSWPDAGLSIHYRVYLQGLDTARTTATDKDGATITGLRPGSYLATVVPLNYYDRTGPAAAITFTVP
jgi:hypothetical protein